jgi:DNA polymerase III epsilon subunit-like protein
MSDVSPALAKFLADLDEWRARWLAQPVGSWKKRSELARPKGYAIVDVETTGTKRTGPGRDRVVSIAIRRCDADGNCLDVYDTLVNPGRPMPAEAAAINGITDEMLASAPPFAEVARKIARLIDGNVFTAFNCPFDLPMLEGEFERIGKRLGHDQSACLLAAWRVLEPEADAHKLGDWAAFRQIEFEAHDASEDTRVAEDLLQWLLARDVAPESVQFDEDLWVRRKVQEDPESRTTQASEASVRFVFYMARRAGWLDEFGDVQTGRVKHLCEAMHGCKLDEMTVLQQTELVDAFRLLLVRQRKKREAEQRRANSAQ